MIDASSKIPGWIRHGLGHPLAVAAAMSLGLRFGRNAYRYKLDEVSDEDLQKKLGEDLGAVTGTLVGAAAGLLVPGAARTISVFAGALFGHIAGEHAGRIGAEKILKQRKERRAAETKSDDKAPNAS